MKKFVSLSLPFLVLTVLISAEAPKPGVDRSPFGAQTVWPSDPDLVTILDRMQQAGIKWTRFEICWWGLCETQKGVYNFTSPDVAGWESWNADRAVALLQQRDIEPFCILCYGNELYDNGEGPYSEEGRKAFGNYCYEAAKRYKDSISYWEIWNEPNLEFFWSRTPDPVDYTKLVKVAAKRIREANPNAVIAGGATSGVDFSFLETCFQNGMLEVVDIVTVHPYRSKGPESFNQDLAVVRNKIKAHTQRPVKVWTGEWGYNTYVHKLSENGQAKCLARMMVNNLSQGVELSIWFSTHAFPESSGEIRDPEWGLLDYDYNPRPSFYAMQTLNKRMAAPIKSIPDPFSIEIAPALQNQRVEVFERDEGASYTVALWTERWPVSDSFTGDIVTVKISVPAETAIHAYDSLTDNAFLLDIEREKDQIVLQNFRIYDYPILLEIALPEKADKKSEGFIVH